MKKFIFYVVLGTLMFFNCRYALASVQTDIEKANKNGKAVFLVMTEPGVKETGQALDIAKEAQKLAPESTVIEMNRADTGNSQFIAKNKLANAPVPLILLIASNGVVTGGLPAEKARPDMLVKMIPSPGKAEIVKALSEGKAVFVMASRNSMGDRAKVLDSCKNACKELKDKSVFVPIDMDDKKESSFLQQLRVNMDSTEPATVVVNAQGQVTGNFTGPVEVAKLTQAAVARGGCGPGSKGCGPSNKGCAVPPR
jgi:hypothetical protein